jgi:hypothetical protein
MPRLQEPLSPEFGPNTRRTCAPAQVRPGVRKRTPSGITVAVALQQMRAKDVDTALEGLTNVIGPNLAKGRASFHIDVETALASSTQKAA